MPDNIIKTMKIKLFETISSSCPECDADCKQVLRCSGSDWVEISEDDLKILEQWANRQYYNRYVIIREVPQEEVCSKLIDIKAVIAKEQAEIRKRVKAAADAKAKADAKKEETARARKEKQLAKLKAELGVE